MFADKSYLYGMWVLILLFLSDIKADIPGCDYIDTVRLSQAQKLPNGSYKYDKIIIPPDQIGEYDYEILMHGERESVAWHLRGCACHIVTCIRYCCPKDQILVANERKCVASFENPGDFDGFVDIAREDGSQMRKHLVDDLIVQHNQPVPCANLRYFRGNEIEAWNLVESGHLNFTLNFETGNMSFQRSRQEHCFQTHHVESSNKISMVQLIPYVCGDLSPDQWVPNIMVILSIICFLLTIIVYMSLPKLRNLHGICFVCYLFSLSVAFVLLLTEKLFTSSEWACKVNGYVGYFAVMSVFHWLTVMSFDLWKSFRGTNYNIESTVKRRFAIYSLCVWTTAAVLTIIIIIMDSILDPENDRDLPWMPGVGVFNCWVKTDDWSAMLYYYGPMSIQIICNLVMFIMTTMSILKAMGDMNKVVRRNERHQRFQSNKKNNGLFVRLLIIMGVPWVFEIVSYLAQSNVNLKNVLLLFDFINSGQGILIFVMFVLKRSVLKQITNCMRGIELQSDDQEDEIGLHEREDVTRRRDIIPNILT